jgi:GTPase SAR1 family protein
MKKMEESIKCVFLGDPMTGKTSLLCSYSRDYFSNDYTPTVVNNVILSLKKSIPV